MPFTDFRSFLAHLEARREVRRVRAEVDPRLEISEIAQRTVREAGPALVFERVSGARFPLAINFFGSMRRIEMAVGMHPEELGERLVSFAETFVPPDPSLLWRRGGLSAVVEHRSLVRRLASFRPKRVRRAVAQSVVERDPDLGTLPAITCWPGDGGPFITFPLVLTRDPVTAKTNAGIYRMHVFDRDTTGMHWQIHKGGGFHYHRAESCGQSLPLVTVLGADPALMLAGMFPLPEGIEEIAFAGVVRGRRTRLARALTCDLPVPADAEIVLEGEVFPGERRLEGPFGDHFGHYSAAADFPVYHVSAMTHRPGAVYPAAVVGKPPQEDRYMGDATQAIVGPLIRLMRPEVRSLWAYYEAGFHNLLVAALEGRYTREPVRSALGILGEGQLGLSKCLILVDSGVDARSFPAVLRAIRDHFDPRENVIVIPRAPLDTLDFTSFEMHRGSRMIVDATGNRADYSGGGGTSAPSPPVAADAAVLVGDPCEIAPRVRRWRLWEDTLLLVQVDRVSPAEARATLDMLVGSPALTGVKIVAAVSPDVDVDDDVEAIWGVFTRFDPARDLVFTRSRLEGAQPVFEGVMGIDATWKPGYPDPLEMSEDIVRKVDRRWQDYWK